MKRYNYDTFYIIFRDGFGWKRRFLKKGFGHIFVVTGDEYNWLEFDPGTRILNITVLPFLNTDDPMKTYIRVFDHLKYDYRILKVTLDDERPSKRAYLVPSCVNICLYIMCLKLWALTPFSLWRKLLNLSIKKKAKLYIKSVEIIK